ncbi:hydrogenase maturation protease [Bacillus marinisedimentorum]|uniref:hydrogenase maturation protease n=1 Tax=Bacillus marinisedimentorum TaxID=1821260 RepID=UPI0007DEC1FB|nr:hydrogenase maturation protease [Bacillus marinisedimentorum]
MGDVLVLGIGNQLMMDDGIGIYLVEELEKRFGESNIRFEIGESDIDYAFEQIEAADFVLILDAIYAGKRPGEVSVLPLSGLHESQPLGISPHNLHLFQMLHQQRETIKGFLIGVEPGEVRFHMGLSDVAAERWEGIVDEVAETCAALLKQEEGRASTSK